MDVCLNLCGRGDSNDPKSGLATNYNTPAVFRTAGAKIVFFFNILILPSVRIGVYLPEQFAYCHLDLLVAAVDHLLSLIADEEVGLQL